LDSPNFKEFADAIKTKKQSKRCFSGMVEIIVVKEVITQLEQFLHFPQCFLKSSGTTGKIPLLFGKGLRQFMSKWTNITL